MAHCLHLHRLHRGCSIVDEKPWVCGWVGGPPLLRHFQLLITSISGAGGRAAASAPMSRSPLRRQDDGDGGAGSLSGPPLTLLGPTNEIASFQPFFFFSFRPSWSSSTPAYGTLLPWGRTMRKLLPVSPFFFSLFSDLFSLCFSLQVQALGQGLHLSRSLQI